MVKIWTQFETNRIRKIALELEKTDINSAVLAGVKQFLCDAATELDRLRKISTANTSMQYELTGIMAEDDPGLAKGKGEKE